MQVSSIVCDWFAPHEDRSPVIFVISHDCDEDVNFLLLDHFPELLTPFIEEFGEDVKADGDDVLSEFLYPVFAVDVDVIPLLRHSEAHGIHVTISQ